MIEVSISIVSPMKNVAPTRSRRVRQTQMKTRRLTMMLAISTRFTTAMVANAKPRFLISCVTITCSEGK